MWRPAPCWSIKAGGLVTAFDGSAYDVTNHRILASNGLIHDEMIALLAEEE